MKKLHVLAAAAVIGAMSMSVQADSQWSLNYGTVDFDGDATPSAIDARYQMNVTDMFDVEFVLGFGIGDDDGAEVASRYGLAGVYTHEFSDGFDGFVTLGYNSVEVDVDNVFGTFSADDAGIGYGLGVNYDLGSGFVTARYESIVDGDDLEAVTGMSIGYGMSL